MGRLCKDDNRNTLEHAHFDYSKLIALFVVVV